ncbi:hypothetical protein DFP93_10854 [Aneurinibacillus soli]|uniref:Uncharacterized protein n=1 Tax=Aneurinibacillus soli TaxID=1500254 RepID=A0A0U4NC33_9BACL|nr:hypothetical protein [Aneurinibacillus soli]PYE61481.1 hypothetical protein DFP93_10854 [Aneurinibacillus soli]BAU26564.1 hypothetical protein CB4_00691 [Aneurinibacillus soli]
MDRKYTDNQTVQHRIDNEEECFLREQLVWVKERMDVLDLIEAKLKRVRTLVCYVVEHKLTEEEAADMQVEVDDLLREIALLSQEEDVYH